MTRGLQTLNDMGIDVWVRRDARAAPAAVPATPAAQPPGERAAPAGPSRIDELAALARDVAACVRCELHETRTQTVFGIGDAAARLLVIGEAPGADEDRKGEPFVGRAGQLLDAMLRAIGVARGAAYIANILKCRPPGNRDPKPAEVASCAAYLERQVALIAPRVILAVGRIAAQNLLDETLPIGKMRGRGYTYRDTNIPVIVTYHPAYLLRSPQEKRKAWDDLLRVKAILEE